MSIHPETEIVATAHDPVARLHTYTISRHGRRWTVQIPDDDFSQYGPVLGASAAQNKMNRRRHLATRIEAAMQGQADE